VTTARAPARRECPGSHEQYLLLKGKVTRLTRRVPDRKDTLDHGKRVCLGKNGTIPIGRRSRRDNGCLSLRFLKRKEERHLNHWKGNEPLCPDRLSHGSAIIRPTRVG